LAEAMLFFYEVYELQFNCGEWTSSEPEPSASLALIAQGRLRRVA
jgi:hypothetical protein